MGQPKRTSVTFNQMTTIYDNDKENQSFGINKRSVEKGPSFD